MSHRTSTTPMASLHGSPESWLVDHPQRRVRSHGFEGVSVDVRAAIHARGPVLLEQSEPDQPVDGRAADAFVGGSVVDRHQFCQVDQILAVRAIPLLHHCDTATTTLGSSADIADAFLSRS